MHYTMVEPSCSNFRVITSIFWGVRNFRIFTVWANSADPDQTAPLRLLLEEQSDQGLHCLPSALFGHITL